MSNLNITIRYHNGSFTVNSLAEIGNHCTSAAQMHQAIDHPAVQEIFRNRLGNYRWTLQGDTYSGYHIQADWQGNTWREIRTQRTPRAAFNLFIERYNLN